MRLFVELVQFAELVSYLLEVLLRFLRVLCHFLEFFFLRLHLVGDLELDLLCNLCLVMILDKVAHFSPELVKRLHLLHVLHLKLDLLLRLVLEVSLVPADLGLQHLTDSLEVDQEGHQV